MEEVDLLCDHIIILDHGKIIAEGTSESLKKSTSIGEKVTVTIPRLSPKIQQAIRKLPGVKEGNRQDNSLVIMYEKSARKPLAALIEYLDKESIEYSDITSEQPTLNDVFLELTGKELRD